MISAYRIGGKVWMVNTQRVADPKPPRTLPIGSTVKTVPEARLLVAQLEAAAAGAADHAAKRPS